MKHIIYLICFLALSLSLHPQSNIDLVLEQVAKNNSSLKAQRSRLSAEKVENSTGNYLQNPEVEFHYLWSNPGNIGNRTDISIKQGMDFPTAYKYRNKISDLKNQQLELNYTKQMKDIMLLTRSICLKLVYTNSLNKVLTLRLNNAVSIADAYKSKYDIGETNILEYNKAQMGLISISNKLELNKIERASLLSDLVGLNGGIPMSFDDHKFEKADIPVDFDQWYINLEQNNPVLNWLKQEIEVAMFTEKYNRAMSLPKLEAGYMSEKLVGEQFQGVIIGLSIPLWENKNTVKYAKENTLAYKDITVDTKILFYNNLKTLHSKAVLLQKNATNFSEQLALLNSTDLLLKALSMGEISLIEYYYEISMYYDSQDNLMEMELELNQTIAELNKYITQD